MRVYMSCMYIGVSRDMLCDIISYYGMSTTWEHAMGICMRVYKSCIC